MVVRALQLHTVIRALGECCKLIGLALCERSHLQTSLVVGSRVVLCVLCLS